MYFGFAILKPLPEEVVREYFKKLEITHDESLREEIILHNTALIIERINKRFFNDLYDKKDLASVGLLGLIRAVDAYRLDKNVRFSTYATICIDRAISNYLIKCKNDMGLLSMESLITDDIMVLETIKDDKEGPEECYLNKELREEIRNFIANLDDLNKNIMEMFYFKNLKQREIAVKLNCKRSYVAMRLRKNLEVLRNELEQKNNKEQKLKLIK